MVSLPLANVYVMIGRSLQWANASNSSLLDDTYLPAPYDTVDYANQLARDGMIMKKITAADLQLVAPRVDWVANTVYIAYNQTTNLFVKTISTTITGGNVNVSGALANTVVANGINLAALTPDVISGTLITVGTETKEVHYVTPNGTFLRVNTAFANTYTSQNLQVLTTSAVQYSNKFYVRNNMDQVFKCLFNNDGGLSSIMPEIALDGQLPENPYIETSDNYKWKYLYTIPSGLKNKFFTDKYMPVLRESIVYDNAVGGSIDIIKINSGGSGYYAGGSVNNYAIATVTGDGTRANVTVDVTSGVITDINILDGGNNYTTAIVALNDPLQTSLGANANLSVVISPSYGHGAYPVREIGASDIMISVDFDGDLGGELPTESDGTDTIRQISIIKDPQYANGAYATSTYLPVFTELSVSAPSVTFDHNAIVYSGSSYENAAFTARVVHFDDETNLLLINNIAGNVNASISDTIYQYGNPLVTAKVFTVTKPDINIFSGELLYVENRAKITRSPDQTETTKLVVEF
jgi:hypothetical protein